MKEAEREVPESYVAARTDDQNPENKIYLSGLLTWTRSLAMALKGDLSRMTNLVQKLTHAFPDLRVEKEEGSIDSDSGKSISNA